MKYLGGSCLQNNAKHCSKEKYTPELLSGEQIAGLQSTTGNSIRPLLQKTLLHSLRPDETKSFFLKRQQVTLEVEIFHRPCERSKFIQKTLLNEITEITKQAWEDFGDVVHKWFDWASLLVLVKFDGKVVGFNACTFEGNNIVLFLASFVLPDYQSDGIAKKMQNLMIKKFLQQRGKKHFFEPVWFTFRTRNPRVMQTIAKFNAFPSIDDRKPSTEEVMIARNVAARFSPHCEFDERYFVLKGALKDKPELLTKDKVFYSRNQKLNDFCNKHMEYDKHAGHLFIPVGRLNWMHKTYFWLMF